jgi:hypothetical protein
LDEVEHYFIKRNIMRYASRIDANQTVIVEGLRDAGRSVVCTHTQKKGFPDLVVGYKGKNWLLEVKDARGKLTPEQVSFHSKWLGQINVVETLAEALALTEA